MLKVRFIAFTALLSAILVLGCNSGNQQFPAEVTGKVTLNTAPVTGGSITFHSADGASVNAKISHDGVYFFPNLPEGKFEVTVETESVNPEKKQQEYKGDNSVGGGKSAMYPGKAKMAPPPGGKKNKSENSPTPEGYVAHDPVYVKIAAKYKSKSTSGLTVDVKKGKQVLDISLTEG